jgi:hypothetical protein
VIYVFDNLRRCRELVRAHARERVADEMMLSFARLLLSPAVNPSRIGAPNPLPSRRRVLDLWYDMQCQS